MDADAALVRLAIAGTLGVAGCGVEDVPLQASSFSPQPTPQGSVAACTVRPSALAHLPGLVDALHIDEFNLFAFTSVPDSASGAQNVWRIPKDGSPPVQIATSATPVVSSAVAGDGQVASAVLWTSVAPPGADGGNMGAVWSVGVDAGAEPVILAPNHGAPGALAVIGSNVYWVETVDGSQQSLAELDTVATTGGPVQRLQTLSPDELPTQIVGSSWFGERTPDGGSYGGPLLLWTTWDPDLRNADSAQIVVCPATTPFAPLTRLGGTDAGGAGGVGYDPFAIGDFSSARGIVSIQLADDGGLGSPTWIIGTSGRVENMANAGYALFFVEPGTTTLVAASTVAADAQAPRVVAQGVSPTTALRVDEACVYWPDADAGNVMMVANSIE